MNLRDDDLNEVTRSVVRKILKVGGRWRVYVRSSGTVAMVKADSIEDGRTFPPETLVGTYNREATHAAIREDLLARRAEIVPPVAA
jgi:hypothetical protein